MGTAQGESTSDAGVEDRKGEPRHVRVPQKIAQQHHDGNEHIALPCLKSKQADSVGFLGYAFDVFPRNSGKPIPIDEDSQPEPHQRAQRVQRPIHLGKPPTGRDAKDNPDP